MNHIKCETVRGKLSFDPDGRSQDTYIGRIAIYEQGKRMYSLRAEIIRLNPTDALADARGMAKEMKENNVLTTSWGTKRYLTEVSR